MIKDGKLDATQLVEDGRTASQFIYRVLLINTVKMIKDPSVLGKCSCVIAYVDHGALKFFHKHGFTDDVVISKKFKHLSEHWENSTFMCYLPPYSG